jgi:catechol 2,3-dioxygenase-like lactoylglutathione lyase family enzyme
MEIRELRATLNAKDFDRTCEFYGEVLSLPRVASREASAGRSATYQAGSAQIEVTGTASGQGKDSRVSYHSPAAPMVLTLVVASAEQTYKDLVFRDRNIPGGLHRDAAGKTVFGTHDPDGVRLLFVEE